jgi:hypothetical protein
VNLSLGAGGVSALSRLSGLFVFVLNVTAQLADQPRFGHPPTERHPCCLDRVLATGIAKVVILIIHVFIEFVVIHQDPSGASV